VDPFGYFSGQYGQEAERSGASSGKVTAHQALGAAGGVLGSGLLVPSSVSGIVEGAQGAAKAGPGLANRIRGAATGFATGFKKPVKGLYEAAKTTKFLGRAARSPGGATATAGELKALKGTLRETPLGALEPHLVGAQGDVAGTAGGAQRLMGIADRYKQTGQLHLTPEEAAKFHGQAKGEVAKFTAGLGLGGSIGGAGAVLQYRKGQEAERETQRRIAESKTASVKVAGYDDATAKDVGWYKGELMSPHTVKFKTEFQGIPINVDRPKGFIMKGKDAKGNAWARRYKFDYGFIPKTLGGDHDGLDVFIGSDKKHPYAYWAVQRNEDGSFDEYKVFLGFHSRDDAISAYRQHIPKKFFNGMMTMKVEMMKAMLGKVNPDEKIKRASASAFFEELQWMLKTAAKPEPGELSNEDKVLRGAGAAGLMLAAKSSGEAGVERLLGAQRISHGTSRGGAESILRTGLDPAFGGSKGGGSAAIASPAFIERSKGHVHIATGPMGRRLVAAPHANLGGFNEQVLEHGWRGEPQLAYLKGLLTGSKGKGEVLEGAIPYEDFRRGFVQDPDQIPGIAFKGREKIDPKYLKRGHAGLGSIIRGRGDLGSYIKNHPGRFARGAGLMAVPVAATYGAYSLVKPMVGGTEKTSSSLAGVVDIPKDTSQKEVAKGLRQFNRVNIREKLLRALQSED